MSVATTYAEALHGAAVDTDALEAVASGVGEFATAWGDSAELREALTNPDIDPQAKHKVVTALTEGGHPYVQNLLRTLLDRGRIGELPEIAIAFQSRVARAERRLAVEAVTAIPLPADLRERLVSSIEEKTGQSVDLSEAVDPEIVGGLVLRVGETVVDGSVRSRLDQLRRELTGVSVDSAAVAE